jgi:hypothetical protein
VWDVRQRIGNGLAQTERFVAALQNLISASNQL